MWNNDSKNKQMLDSANLYKSGNGLVISSKEFSLNNNHHHPKH